MLVFAIINKDGIMINADVNALNQLVKEYLIKDLFGILVILNVNVINHLMLKNIQIIKILNVETNQLINQLKNVVIIMIEMK